MSEPRRRCKGYRIDGKRCQRPLKGRQRAYCSLECRVPAERKNHAKCAGNYYQRNKDEINRQRRDAREKERKRKANTPGFKQDDLEVLGF